MSYTRSNLSTSVAKKISGTLAAAAFNEIANQAVRDVLADIDTIGSIRTAALSPNMFDDIFQYTCPADLKEEKIIDIQPQIDTDRGVHDVWSLVTVEEFDRYKYDQRIDKWGDPIQINKSEWLGESLVAFKEDDLVRKILISRVVDDDEAVISTLDSTTAGGGTWSGFGDGTNLTTDTDDYVKGNGSINWDINADGGTTAGIVNSSLDSFDVSDYKTTGSIFVWAYISDTTNLTNFIIRIGSDSSNYYSITITTDNEGNSFQNGWNLLRFDFVNKSTTGTPDDDACTYCAIYMTKDGAKVSETDYRFDHIILKRGEHHNLIYYSNYGWKNAAGTRLENATDDTDILICNTTEYNLIVAKACQLAEEHLKNDRRAEYFEKQYEKKASRYITHNPSKALMLQQRYYEF